MIDPGQFPSSITESLSGERAPIVSTFRVAIFGLAISLQFGAASQAEVILFDNIHNQDSTIFNNPDFTMARAALEAAGHTLAELNSPLDPVILSGVDIYVTGLFLSALTTNEAMLLSNFVDQGGGVVVTHGGGFSSSSFVDSINEFLEPYGMQLGPNVGFGSGVTATFDSTACASDGVSTVSFDFLRELELIQPPAQNLIISGPEVAAAATVGSGFVIVIGDENQWKDPVGNFDAAITEFDNELLLERVFGFADFCFEPQFRRGDINLDALVNVADAITLLQFLFVAGSPILECEDAGDSTDDGLLDVADAVTLLFNLFVPGSPPLPEPGDNCGSDPTDDALDCADPSGC